MPITVSTNSPSMSVRPSTSKPRPTKNAVTASRSATVIPTWSKRRMADTVIILRQSQRGLLMCDGDVVVLLRNLVGADHVAECLTGRDHVADGSFGVVGHILEAGESVAGQGHLLVVLTEIPDAGFDDV